MSEWNNPYYDAPEHLQPEIDRLTAEMQRRSKYWAKWPDRYSPAQTIRSWARAAEKLILSEKHLSDEYVHDLDKRRSVHRLMAVAYELELADLLNWMIPIVDATDERFRDITTADTENLFNDPSRNRPEYWWYRRMSTNPYTLNQFREIDAAYKARHQAEEEE